jgi:hypothetical protein
MQYLCGIHKQFQIQEPGPEGPEGFDVMLKSYNGIGFGKMSLGFE